MRFLIIAAICFFLATLAFANSEFDPDGVAYDHNTGGAFRLDVTKNGAELYKQGESIGVWSNFELFATGINTEKRHITFVDVNLKSMMGLQTGEDDYNFLFNLRGNISGGVQAYSLIPLTLAFEDAELDVSGGDVKGTYLFGSALLVPIGHILKFNRENRQLAMTLSLGVRENKMVAHDEGTYPAMQVKIRFLNSPGAPSIKNIPLSLYASMLFDISKKENLSEKKGSFGFAVNNLLGKGSQIGVEGSHTKLSIGDKKEEISSMIFFIGSDLF